MDALPDQRWMPDRRWMPDQRWMPDRIGVVGGPLSETDPLMSEDGRTVRASRLDLRLRTTFE